MGFVDEMHEAWQIKATQLIRDIISDYDNYIARHDRESAAKDAVVQAADEHTKAESRLDGANDSAYWYQKLCKALAALKAVRDGS